MHTTRVFSNPQRANSYVCWCMYVCAFAIRNIFYRQQISTSFLLDGATESILLRSHLRWTMCMCVVCVCDVPTRNTLLVSGARSGCEGRIGRLRKTVE